MSVRALLVVLPLALIGTSPVFGQDVSDFDRVVTNAFDQGRFAGVVLVQTGGSDLYSRAVGDAVREFGVPHDRWTRFKFHSLTKPIVSAALYSLVMEGLIELDESICRYLDPCPSEWAPVEGVP